MRARVMVAAVAVAAFGLPVSSAAAHGGGWQRYVDAPASRDVQPVRVIATTGDVVNPTAMLHGGVTRLIAPKPPTPPRWPTGTTATASSYHTPNNGDGGTATVTYVPGNAIDDNPQTFWNDATPDTYPAWLQISSPTAVTLPGITLLSNSDGVPEDFTVSALENGSLTTVATVTGNSAIQVPVRFTAPVTTTEIRITVTLDQSSPEGDYTRINEIYPGIVQPVTQPSVTLDYGRDIVGFPRFAFAGATDHAGIRVAFSETREYLTDRSDFTRSDFSGGPGTDQHVPSDSGPSTWTDTDGCQFGTHVCADGLHGFRYEKITLDAVPSDVPDAEPYSEVSLRHADLHFTAYLGTPNTYRGWFLSSDDALNRYWYGASYTNELVDSVFQNGSVDPRGANNPGLDGERVLMDGAKRDRDPYSGDIAVSGLTDYLTHDDRAAVTDVLSNLADHQLADGYIPPASIDDYGLQLFEYPLYWAIDTDEYALYNGAGGYPASALPHLQRLLNDWYPSVTDANGLLDKGLNGTGGFGDYAFLPRTGEVTYYNDLYVLALRDSSQLASELGDGADAAAWAARARTVSAAINAHLWDASVGAYIDSTGGPLAHPQDANGWAIVAGVATGQRARDALAYLSAHTQTPWGNSFYDNDSVVPDGTTRVYAFTSYPEILARFTTGEADSAVDEIDRLYGCMSSHDPGITDWEGVGADCTPYEQGYTSMAHGWSTGVVSELTNGLLGVTPTSAGFATWSFDPSPGSVRWAEGEIPTPHGPIIARWHRFGSRFAMWVSAPRGTTGTVTVPALGSGVRVSVNGRVTAAHSLVVGS